MRHIELKSSKRFLLAGIIHRDNFGKGMEKDDAPCLSQGACFPDLIIRPERPGMPGVIYFDYPFPREAVVLRRNCFKGNASYRLRRGCVVAPFLLSFSLLCIAGLLILWGFLGFRVVWL